MREQKLHEANEIFLDKLRSGCYNNKANEVVLGNGNIDAIVLMIGEAPGANEVKEGKPFVGAAGKNLTLFLDKLNLKREELYITNTVKFRPTALSDKTGKPVNRKPDINEIAFCRELLLTEIELVLPKVIVTLGNVALLSFMSKETTIGDVHGQVLKYGETPLFPLYHPASVIYNQKLKEVYDKDLNKLKEFLDRMAAYEGTK